MTFVPRLTEAAITARIATFLLAHPGSTVTQIMDGTHLSRLTTKTYVDRWYEKGHVAVRRAKNGYTWTLTDSGTDALVRSQVSDPHP